MQPKKNPKADLSKNSSLFFVIGLSLILLITWRAIEWKTYARTYDYEALSVDDDDEIIIFTFPISFEIYAEMLDYEFDDDESDTDAIIYWITAVDMLWLIYWICLGLLPLAVLITLEVTKFDPLLGDSWLNRIPLQ